jgi:two-component system, NarL family, invasion response regulator UvrY
MRPTIQVLIVDDNRYFREIVRVMLERDFYKVWEAATVAQATYLLDKMPLDIVLLDARLGSNENGSEVAQYMRREKIFVPLLGITTYEGTANLLSLVKAGVMGILLKSSTGPAELAEAIETILAGHEYYPARVKELISNKLDVLATIPDLRLTENERELLHHFEKGLTEKEISHHFNLPIALVEDARERLKKKTETSSVPELVAFAYRNGLLP